MFNKASLKCKKIITLTALSASFLLAATGCGKDAANDRLGKGNQVENVINDQMAKEQGTTEGKSEEMTAASTEKASSAPAKASTEDSSAQSTEATAKPAEISTTEASVLTDIPTLNVDPETIDYDNVDIDITEMSSDMVYATVYQMVYNPQDYVGKTVKIKGQYFVAYSKDEGNDNFYNYCLVADAAACCQQGLEFLCNDGHSVYPDDFPEDGTDIEVTGVFEMYHEGAYTYTRLNYAKMQVGE